MNAAVETKSVATELFEFRQAQAVANGASSWTWDNEFLFDRDAELEFAERLLAEARGEQNAAIADKPTFPRKSDLVIRFGIIGKLFNDVSDKVRYNGSDNFRFSSWETDNDKIAEGIIKGRKSFALVQQNSAFAAELLEMLDEMIAAGAAEEEAAHMTACYKWHDLQQAISRAVTIDEIAQQVAYETAYASTKNKTRRYAFNAYKLVCSYATANDVERNLVEQQVADYIAANGISFIKSRQVWVYKADGTEIAKSAE